MLNPPLSRREFLKLATTGSLAFALQDLKLDRALAASALKQGLMTFSGTPMYDAPAFTANKLFNFGKDQVVDVTGVEENGEKGNPFNTVWYQVNNEGYSYSGWVLPVETRYQKPMFLRSRPGQVLCPCRIGEHFERRFGRVTPAFVCRSRCLTVKGRCLLLRQGARIGWPRMNLIVSRVAHVTAWHTLCAQRPGMPRAH